MQIVLTGATGYIGGAVAERRRAAGHEPTGPARSDAPAARPEEARQELLGWRPPRPDVLEDVERGSYAESKA